MSNLPDLLAALSSPPPEDDTVLSVSSDDFAELWTSLVGDTFIGRQGLQVFLEAIEDRRDGFGDAQFEYSPRGWVVRLRTALLQSVVSAGLLAGALAMCGADQLPAAIAAAAIPLVFVIDRVSLSEGDRYILARLRSSPGVVGDHSGARKLYDKLPNDLAADIPYHDFLDFLEACQGVGAVKMHKDGSIEVEPAGREGLTIRFE
jgi:hypothetical protein